MKNIDYYMNMGNEGFNAAKESVNQYTSYVAHAGLLCYTATRAYMQAMCLGLTDNCPVDEMTSLLDLLDVIIDCGVAFEVDKDGLREMDACYKILIKQAEDVEHCAMPWDVLVCMENVKEIADRWYSLFAGKESSVSTLLKQAEG